MSTKSHVAVLPNVQTNAKAMQRGSFVPERTKSMLDPAAERRRDCVDEVPGRVCKEGSV